MRKLHIAIIAFLLVAMLTTLIWWVHHSSQPRTQILPATVNPGVGVSNANTSVTSSDSSGKTNASNHSEDIDLAESGLMATKLRVSDITNCIRYDGLAFGSSLLSITNPRKCEALSLRVMNLFTNSGTMVSVTNIADILLTLIASNRYREGGEHSQWSTALQIFDHPSIAPYMLLQFTNQFTDGADRVRAEACYTWYTSQSRPDVIMTLVELERSLPTNSPFRVDIWDALAKGRTSWPGELDTDASTQSLPAYQYILERPKEFTDKFWASAFIHATSINTIEAMNLCKTVYDATKTNRAYWGQSHYCGDSEYEWRFPMMMKEQKELMTRLGIIKP